MDNNLQHELDVLTSLAKFANGEGLMELEALVLAKRLAIYNKAKGKSIRLSKEKYD